MRVVPSLPVAVPLLVAALLAAGSRVLPRRAADAIAVGTALSVAGLSGWLLWSAGAGIITYWFGGWRPHDAQPVSVGFAIDAVGAGMALVVALLVTAALVFSWRYFRSVGTRFHVLMLVFLAAMAGFALTGDLFNLFVWFELMGVAAFALTGYKIEEGAPLQGALNFGITNTLGGFMVLIGIALVYGRTGTLNMAAAGRALAGSSADGLVVVAFVFVLVGFLTKGAIVPFHFWLADAHAVAPSPVCVLFSGIMVELGLYGVARVYWTVFSGTLSGSGEPLRTVLVVGGVLTALVGGVMCFSQHHLKRLLAFSTVGHAGMFLIGLGLLTPDGLTGDLVYVVAHAFTKGALFLCAGVVLHRLGSVEIEALYKRGRGLRGTAALFMVGGLALAGLPPFGTALGKGLLEHAAAGVGWGWVALVLALTSALTGGAVLRAGLRVFLGWGPPPLPDAMPGEGRETVGGRGRTPAVMTIPIVLLLGAALAVGVAPAFAHLAPRAADRFQDRPAYAAAVLTGSGVSSGVSPGVAAPGDWWTRSGIASSLAATAVAVALAVVAVFRDRIGVGLRRTMWRRAGPGLEHLRALHSGQVVDYVAWMMLGTIVLGGVLGLGTR